MAPTKEPSKDDAEDPMDLDHADGVEDDDAAPRPDTASAVVSGLPSSSSLLAPSSAKAQKYFSTPTEQRLTVASTDIQTAQGCRKTLDKPPATDHAG